MAFNPFNAFRKYRKTMFAILTIICMFVFILSTGLGGKADPFNLACGQNSRAGEVVAKLDGEKINSAAVEETRRNRRIANEYITRIVMSGIDQLFDRAPAQIKNKENQSFVNQLVRTRTTDFQGYFQNRNSIRETLRDTAKRAELMKETAEAEVLNNLARALDSDITTRLNVQQNMRFMFFEDMNPANSVQDLLDFMVWKWVADKRDIRLTPEMVDDLIRQDAFSQDIDQANREARKELRTKWRITNSALTDILTDEYRVRLAKTVVYGLQPLMSEQQPSNLTPYEAYQQFRDHRTGAGVHLLQIAAESFVDKVTEQPTEKALKDLFAANSTLVAQPDQERPGFKDPIKIKVDFITVTKDNATFKKAAMESAQKDQLLADSVKKLMQAPPAPNLASVMTWMTQLDFVENPKLIEKRKDAEYQQYVQTQKFYSRSRLDVFPLLQDRSWFDPKVIALSVADQLTRLGTGNTHWTTPGTWYSQALIQEMRSRTFAGALTLSALGQGPIPALGLDEMMVPRPLKREDVSGMLLEKSTQAIESGFLGEVTEKLRDTIVKLGGEDDAASFGGKHEWRVFLDDFVAHISPVKFKLPNRILLNAYVADFAKKYGFKRGSSAEFQSQHNLINDPGLKLLRDAYLNDPTTQGDKKGTEFLWHSFGRDFPKGPIMFQFRGAFPYWFEGNDPVTDAHSKPDKQFHFVWKSDHKAERERTFAEAKADVERAWKLMKARELAKKAAEDLQKEAREKAFKSAPALRDFAAEKKLELIELQPVAKINRNPLQTANRRGAYLNAAGFMLDPQRPSVLLYKVPYATEEFPSKIVEMRDKPLGETTLLIDRPKNNYYVAVLTQREEPMDFEFQQAYRAFVRDELLMLFEQQHLQKHRRAIVEQLRVDAKLDVNKDAIKQAAEEGSADAE